MSFRSTVATRSRSLQPTVPDQTAASEYQAALALNTIVACREGYAGSWREGWPISGYWRSANHALKRSPLGSLEAGWEALKAIAPGLVNRSYGPTCTEQSRWKVAPDQRGRER